nr:RNA polymerase II elongation factor ELL-like [Lytechinus pictus]
MRLYQVSITCTVDQILSVLLPFSFLHGLFICWQSLILLSLSLHALQVATLARDNSYVLNKNLYNEVNLDWPAYSEADKQLLHRKKAECGIKDSPSPQSQPSPHHTSTNSGPTATGSPSTQATSKPIPSHRKKPDTGTKSSTKRPLLPEVKDYKTKKPRIAHGSASMGAGPKSVDQQPQLSPSSALSITKKVPSPIGLFKKVPSPSSTTNAPPSTTTTISNSPSSNHAQQSALSSPSVSTTRNSPDCCDSTGNGTNSSIAAAPAVVTCGITKSSSSSSSRDHSRASGRSEKSSKTPSISKSVKEEKRPVGKESPSGDVSSTSVVPEYQMKYTTITTVEQRNRYKEDFNRLYPEYREFHKSIERIKQQFKDLKDVLNETKKGSKEYDSLQDKVIEEYNKITQDEGYGKKEKRWRELHDLLGHIKTLIMAYDTSPMQTDNSCGMNDLQNMAFPE